MEPDDAAAQGSSLDRVYTLVELRRKAFRFLDMRGKVADDLLSSYDNVTFDGPTIGLSQRLSVEWAGTARTGAIDAEQATVAEQATEAGKTSDDPTSFASEGMVFLRRVERQMHIGTYDRVGIRTVFETPAPETVQALAASMVGFRPRDSWALSEFRIRSDTERNGWVVWLMAGPIFEESGAGRAYLHRVRLDVDQFRMRVPAQEALQLDLSAAIDRARYLAAEFLRGGEGL